MYELLDQLSGRGRVEDVVLDGDVLVVQLLQKAEGSDGLTTGAETCLAKLLRENLRLKVVRIFWSPTID